MVKIKKILRYAWDFSTKKQYRNHVKSVFNYFILEKREHQTSEIKKYDVFKDYKVFIIGGCELSHFKETLKNYGIETIHTFDLNTSYEPMGEINNANSMLWYFKPNVIVFSYVQKFRNLVYKIQNHLPHLEDNEVKNFLDNLEEEIILTVTKIRKVYKFLPIYIATYPLTYKPNFGLHEYKKGLFGNSLIEALKNFELLLYKLTKKIDDLHVIDIDVAIQYMGKEKAIDKSCSNAIYDHLSKDGGKEVAHHFLRMMIQSEPSIGKIKCAVLDLDNTLWTGTLIEDGPENLSIKPNFIDFIELLINRNLIVCICSKNNPEDEKVIGKILGPIFDQIMIKKINWRPKSININEIAKELNLGLESIAFFDDNKFEREEVSTNAEGVKVFSNLDFFRVMSDSIFFTNTELTKESSTRHVLYKTQLIRKDIEQKSLSESDYSNFLKNSSLKLNIYKASKTDLPRVFELLSKTNQMNLTLKRTSKAKVSEYFYQNNITIFCFNLSDRYGEYGLIGTMIIEKKVDYIHIEEITLSCRAMGRDIEDCMFIFLNNFFKNNFKSIKINIINTDKNAQMVRKLVKNGFSCIVKNNNTYEKQIKEKCEKYPEWITIQEK